METGERRDGAKLVTGLALGGVAIVCLVTGPLPLSLFLLAVAIVASGELFRLCRARGIKPVPLVGFAGIAALFAIAYRRGENAPVLFPGVVAGAVGLALLAMLVRRRRSGVTLGVATTALAVVWIGLLGAYIVALRRSPGGFRITLVFGLMALLHDIGGFAVGALRAGRHPLAPVVSPAKSWEGWAGGTVLTFVVAAVAATKLPPFTWPSALVLAALMSVSAPLGDLAESMVKRDVGALDSGRVIPGHGGVLDLIDSVLVSAPIFFYAFRVLAR